MSRPGAALRETVCGLPAIRAVCIAPASLSHASARAACFSPISKVCGCTLPSMRTTGSPHLSRTAGSSVTRPRGRGNLLRRPHHDDGPLVPVAHRLLVSLAPARCARRQPVDHVNRKPDELVGQHPSAAQTRSAVVVVAHGDRCPRPDVVVGFKVEVARGARIVVALQIAAHLVVAISQPIRKQLALRIQQQPRRLGGAA